MNRKSSSKMTILLAAVLVVGLVALGVLQLRSRLSTMNSLKANLRSKQTELAELQGKQNRQPELEADYQQLRDRLALLEPTLPTSAYIPTFLKQIERIAVETGNQISGIRPLPKLPSPTASAGGDNPEGTKPAENQQQAKQAEQAFPYDTVPIEVNLKGNYYTTINFMDRLRRFPKMIAVNELAFSSASQPRPGEMPMMSVKLHMIALITKDGDQWKKRSEIVSSLP